MATVFTHQPQSPRDSNMASVAVVGGGISGLTAAYYLLKLGRKVTLIEKSSVFGGWIKSSRFDDGTIHEQGPRSIRPLGDNGLTTLQMVDELGLSNDVLPVRLGHPATTKRLILVNGQLQPLPTKISALFKATPPFTKPLGMAIIKEFFTPKKEVVDESMYEFTLRRYGKEIADYAVDPLCRGVVAGDSKEISVLTVLKPLFVAEQKHGSITKGMIKLFREKKPPVNQIDSKLVQTAKEEKWRMWNLKNGLQSLPETLVNAITKSGCKIYTKSPCDKIVFSNDGKAEITFTDNKLLVDHVFTCIPANSLCNVIENHPTLSELMSQIQSVSVGLINLEYNENFIKQPAFGFLVPSIEKSKILGVVYDSCSFPEHNGARNPNKTRLTVMMGGRWFDELFGDPTTANSEVMMKTAVDAVEQYLNIKEQPSRHQVHILKNCIPQYTVGHVKRVSAIRDYINSHHLPLSLIGSSYDGVSVNDCVYNAKKCVEEFVKCQ